jgi:hypothetical protein
VLAVHAEGSLEAEKLMIWRSYDPAPAPDLARRLARLDGHAEALVAGATAADTG